MLRTTYDALVELINMPFLMKKGINFGIVEAHISRCVSSSTWLTKMERSCFVGLGYELCAWYLFISWTFYLKRILWTLLSFDYLISLSLMLLVSVRVVST